jgi:hypothetical protein
MVKLAGGTTKHAKSAKEIVGLKASAPFRCVKNGSDLVLMAFAFLASLVVQFHFPRWYEVARLRLLASEPS